MNKTVQTPEERDAALAEEAYRRIKKLNEAFAAEAA